ncbi:MAG: hypothetical protein PHC34_10565 [Candidatus Gastranaerophilales bacterium]|nr:hypothetical protein [Candidatus Gastranaerophilales bacterium]
MQINNNPYNFNKIKKNPYQYNLNIKHSRFDSVSFQGITSNKLMNKFEELITYQIPKDKNFNSHVLEAKKKLFKLIYEGTDKWPGVKIKVNNDSSYNLQNLAKDLGFSKDLMKTWEHFMSLYDHNAGKFCYTGDILRPILYKLGINKKDTPQIYDSLVEPFKNNDLINAINKLIDFEIPKGSNLNSKVLHSKKEILKLLLDGTDKWPGIKARIDENLSYTYNDLFNDLELPENLIKSFSHFLAPSTHETGKFCYTGNIVRSIMKKLDINSTDTPQTYNLLIEPFKENDLVKTINTIIKFKPASDYSEYQKETLQVKRILLNYLLEGTADLPDGTKKWQGIYAKVNKNLNYGYKDLAKDLGLSNDQMKVLSHFLSPYDHNQGKLSYTKELVIPILRKLGIEDKTFLRDINPSTKSK